MRRFSILHAIPLSFFSGDLYRDVARSWRGIGLAYLLLVVTLLTVTVVIRMQIGLAGFARGEARRFVDQVPRIVIRGRVVEVDAPMPLVIRDTKKGTEVAIIDTTGQITSLDGQEARVLMTADHIYYRKSVAETRMFALSGVRDFTVDSARAKRWLGMFATWASPIAAPFVFVGMACFRLFQQFLLAVVGLLVGRVVGARFDFSAHMRLAAVALTPALIIEPVLDMLGAKPAWWGMIWIVLALAYIVFAVRANAARSAETPAPATPA